MTYEVWSKNNRYFKFVLSIYLFFNSYLLTFKEPSFKYYTLMPAFSSIPETLPKRAFWYRQQLLFWFFFYLLNRSKTISFHRYLQFLEEEKVSEFQVRWIWWLRHCYSFVFGQKWKSIDLRAGALSLCKIHDWLFHNSICFLRNASLLSARSWYTTSNFHIWPNLTCFFRSWLFWTLPFEWLGFVFNT